MNPKRMPALSQKEVNAIRANKPAPVNKRPMPMLTPQQINSIKNSPKGVLPAFIRALQMTKPSKGAGELFIKGTREQYRKNSSK